MPIHTNEPSGRRLLALLVLCPLIVALSCEADGTAPGDGEASITLTVAPMGLSGVGDVTYLVTVTNGDSDVVWSREVSSSRSGDGAGAITYVGPCDAAVNPNTVAVAVVAIEEDSGEPLPASRYFNPAPADNPLTALVECRTNQNTPVAFDITVAMHARQGFFDVAVSFDHIFCSAKLDCLGDGGAPLRLLFDPLTGLRAQTAVLGFACTAGHERDTHLWMDPVVITCDGGGPFAINVAGGPGNLDPSFPGPAPNLTDLVFQAAAFRGAEELDAHDAWNLAYWNIAIGLNEHAFSTLERCQLQGMATASGEPFIGGATPPGMRYPVVVWDVTLIEDGELTCAHHELDSGQGVNTAYTASTGHHFYSSFRRATGEVNVAVGVPDDTSLLSCQHDVLDPGDATTCTITPRQLGVPILAPSDAFQPSASAGAVGPLSPLGLAPSFTFTFTAPSQGGAVTVTSGLGDPAIVLVLGVPDATSTVSCAEPSVHTGASVGCTILARQNGANIFARASDFAPFATPSGAVSAIAEPYGHALTFTYTAASQTGPMTVGDGLGATATVTVVGTPDQTSTLACNDQTLAPGGATVCTLTPRASGQIIHARATAFTLSVDPDGSTTPLTPAIGTSFTFNFNAPATVGTKTIDSGVGVTTEVDVVSSELENLTLPSAPTIVEAQGQDQQIYLRWLPPQDTGGSSNIVYTAVCERVSTLALTAAVTPQLHTYVQGLTNGEGYVCWVYASNELGNGPPSAPTSVLLPQTIVQSEAVVVAPPATIYRADRFDGGYTLRITGHIVAAPIAYTADGFESGVGASAVAAIVAPPVTTYHATTYYDGGAFTAETVGALAATPVTFTAADFDANLGALHTSFVVAPSAAVYPTARYDDGGTITARHVGALAATPVTFTAADFDANLGALHTSFVVAPSATVYPTARYDDGGTVTARAIGTLSATPVVFTAADFDAGFGALHTSFVVAPSAAIYPTARYDDGGIVTARAIGALTATPVVFAAADFDAGLGAAHVGAVVAVAATAVGRPYVYQVAPAAVSRSGPSVELGLHGIGFDHVVAVILYEPGGAPSALATVSAPSIAGDGALTVSVTFDPEAPTGTWTVAVVTGSGVSSPTGPPDGQLGFDNTLVVNN